MMSDPGNHPVTTLRYDIIMATRNRPEAVALSLPLLLAQTRPPAHIFIVDSSDDGSAIAGLAQTAARQTTIPIHYIPAAAGLTLQRNIGLGQSQADVVIFPDDDSLLFPDAAARIMQVYEADAEHRIAAVCADAAPYAPAGMTGDLGSLDAEQMTGLRLSLRRLRQRIKEALAVTNPFLVLGNRLNAQHPLPGWLVAAEATPVPYMTGFRMSFRRAVIATTGFDEALRHYAWFEDIDASCSAMRQGLVVCAKRARIYHHRFAGARAGGGKMGRWAILNRGYIVMKHVDANPAVFPRRDRERLRLRLYCRARVWAYRAMGRDEFGRDRARGAVAGLAQLDSLTACTGPALTARYTALTQDMS